MIVAVPGVTPVTLPLLAVMVTVASGVLQRPPPGVAVSGVITPGHTNNVPLIDDGVALTDKVCVEDRLPQLLESV